MVRYLNLFEVPAGREDEFLAMWQQVNAYMTAKPGYLGHRLHRALGDDARYRFFNYVEWESVEHFRGAHDEGFRAMVSGPEWAAYPFTPGLYDVVHAGGQLA